MADLLRGHNRATFGVAFSATGDKILSASADSTLILWDYASRKPLMIFRGHTNRVMGCALSADGKTILSGGLDNTMSLWNAASGRELRFFRSHTGGIWDVTLSPDGKYALSGGGDSTVKYWDVAKDLPLKTLRGHTAQVAWVRFLPIEGLGVSAGGDGVIILWDLKRGREIRRFVGHSGAVNAMQVSPTGTTILSGGADGQIILWDIRTGLARWKYTAGFGAVSAIQYNLRDSSLIAGFETGKLLILSMENQQPIRAIKASTREILSIAIHPTDDIAVISDRESIALKLFYTTYTQEIKNITTLKMKAWEPKGKYEKTADYLARMSDSSRTAQVATFVQQVIDSLGGKYIQIVPTRNEYDADNEIFKISFSQLPDILLPIPIAEAQAFDAVFAKIKLEKPSFTLSDGNTFQLLHLEFVFPTGGKRYAYDSKVYSAFEAGSLNINLPPVNIALPSAAPVAVPRPAPAVPVVPTTDVDSLPALKLPVNPNAYAVVIGISRYTQANVPDIPFATRDASLLQQYLTKTMGYREGNVILLPDATKGNMELYFGTANDPIGKLANLLTPESELLVYYNGHGAPGLKDGAAYLMPSDADPNYLESQGYPLNQLLAHVARLPAKSKVVVLDACFSGQEVHTGVSPGVIRQRATTLPDTVLVLSATGQGQYACAFPEKGHSLFTYYLLRGMRNHKSADTNHDNQLSWPELFEYTRKEVPYQARRMKNIEQTPTLSGAAAATPPLHW